MVDLYVTFAFRYWAIAVPSFAMVSIILALTFYLGLNFMATPPSTSFNTMFGKSHWLNFLQYFMLSTMAKQSESMLHFEKKEIV